jgi:methyltransferase-like protein
MASNPIIYDELPDTCNAMHYAQPDRLATVATLFGMKPPSVETCRVLELGCCDGSNLIPTAYGLPNAKCWGVDLSAQNIAKGQTLIEVVGLKNITLLHSNILDLDESLGEFDYIIAHGIYSWVSQEIQDKILQICKQHLVPNGVAYVSYHTKPGWDMRETFRNMMLFHTAATTEPAKRTEQLKALTKFIVNTTAQNQDAYSRFVNEEINDFIQLPSSFVAQTFLEESCKPLYFHQFIERIRRQGLEYLGDAFPHTMFINNFPENVVKELQMFKNDLIRQEQMMDFLRNRYFRHTLLCHQNTQLSRTLPSDLIHHVHIASSLQPVASSTDQPLQKFESARGTVSSDKPLIQAAIRYLGQQWPQTFAFADIIQHTQQETGNELDTHETATIADTFLKCYSMGLVELHTHPPKFTTTISQFPQASPLARWQAQQGSKLTTLRCQWFTTKNVLLLQLLPYLDGTRDQATLVNLLDEWIKEDKIVINFKNQQTGEPLNLNDENRLEILTGVLNNALKQIARSALLIA